MPGMNQKRPDASEYASYYGRYVDRVSETDILSALENERLSTRQLIASIDDSRAGYRYAPGKWTIRQLLGHVEDSERVFTYRALTFARGAKTALPGFEQTEFMEHSPFESSTLRQRAEGLDNVRRATLGLFRELDDAAWERDGTASDNRVTVRALAYITLGHERHHLAILRDRYLGKT
jgi:hypothetical protein